MARFYLALAIALARPGAAAAQTAASQERPPLGSSLTVDALGELPASASVFTLLDTSVPDVITDRAARALVQQPLDTLDFSRRAGLEDRQRRAARDQQIHNFLLPMVHSG